MADSTVLTPVASETLIRIQHVSKRYRNVNALDDLSLEIPRGKIFGLIGPNGAGKTTLIRILAALLAPSSGQVWFNNEEVSRSPATIQRQVGYMPDFFGVYPDLTSAEYLEFYAGIHGIPRQKQAGLISDLLELVELTSKRDAMVENLSRGMKQRLCLARALVHDPEVLLLDEPASGLDPRARVELRELVRTLQGMGKTIIISSHILLELAEMCTDIAIVKNGKLVLSGSVDTITSQINGGRQVEIRLLDPSSLPQALDVLKARPEVTQTQIEDQVIQADFQGDDQVLYQMLSALMAENIPVVSFAPRSGGGRLEEIFMQITEGGQQG
ncbi:ABC transporter ATP-binding protein [Tengunoibacter tsumagoiensis]|uniref:ABC transporter n=1 Tax=Tengunoibacter tsumagoiensis TaxID=2014871 RepID=A0A402A2V5_9CHLR|nr:ABC transporter ATP-binding protein [Tengunoibacter tsumagoiensis]GCE13402.1 ABC transporter [Tengunoibacter tsumagoiensis]